MLHEANKIRVAGAATNHKVTEPTIYVSREHFGPMEAADVKRLKSLESEENSRLKKLLG